MASNRNCRISLSVSTTMRLSVLLFTLTVSLLPSLQLQLVSATAVDEEYDGKEAAISSPVDRGLQEGFAPTEISNDPSASPSMLPSAKPTPADAPNAAQNSRPLNVLIIMCDQLRYDALRFIQDQMPIYDKHLKIETPNLDKLARQGVYFQNAYAQSSICVPSRSTLRSGCTIERGGVDGNSDLRKADKSFMDRKIDAIRTYDQMLSSVGYQVESYGKYHLPTRWLYHDSEQTSRAVQYTAYSLDFTKPLFLENASVEVTYQPQVNAWAERDGIQKGYAPGQYHNPISDWPYTPIRLNPTFHGEPDYTGEVIFGYDSLPVNYSQSDYSGLEGKMAIQRLAKMDKPWCLTISLNPPHPPQIVARKGARYYLQNREKLLLPPSIHTPIPGSYFQSYQKLMKAKGFQNEKLVREWTAIYYSMVTRVDMVIGELMDELERQQVDNSTLVVFTSDHGEFLGAHGLQGKLTLFEEAVRVPWLMRLSGQIKAGTVVDRPVSHLDLVATVLDYTEQSHLDQSDGKSLRSVIDNVAYDEQVESNFIVAEVGYGSEGDIGTFPRFMVRSGQYKLMIVKDARSSSPDFLFDLAKDPFEKVNLLDEKRITQPLIGKAEHLKILLISWMVKNDGASLRYYSNPKYNDGVGRGDLTEIRLRRSWRRVNQWQSDTAIQLDRPILSNGQYRTNAWLYIGRTTPGTLNVKRINVKGAGSDKFTLSQTSGSMQGGDYMRVRISYVSDTEVDPSTIRTRIVIESNVYSQRAVRLQTWT